MKYDYKKLFTEERFFTPNFKMPEASDLDQFFYEFYGGSRYMIGDDRNYGPARGDIDKLCQFMRDLGFTKSDDLKRKFSEGGFINSQEASNVKETMETIVYVLGNQRESMRSNLISQYKDSIFNCGPGTLTNLQKIAEGLLLGGVNLDVRIANAKREVIGNIILEMMTPIEKIGKENIFQSKFPYSPAMETHYVKPLVNAVADVYGMAKYDLSEDTFVENKQEDGDLFREIIVEAVDANFAKNGIGAILNQALQKYIEFLPPSTDESANIDAVLASQMKIFGERFHSGVLQEVDEDFIFTGYKLNRDEILEAMFRVAFDERELMKDENLKFHKQIIEIELSADPNLKEEKIGEMNDEIEQYLMQNHKLLSEKDFGTESIFEFLGEEKVRKFLQLETKIKGENSIIYALKNLPEKFCENLNPEDFSKALEYAQNFDELEMLLSRGADVEHMVEEQREVTKREAALNWLGKDNVRFHSNTEVGGIIIISNLAIKGLVQKGLKNKDLQKDFLKFLQKHVNEENYDKIVGVKYVDIDSNVSAELALQLRKFGENFYGKKQADLEKSFKKAVESNHVEIVEFLMTAKKVDINYLYENNQTALHLAAENGHLEIVEKLLAADDINVNDRDMDGKTAFYCALRNAHLAVVEKFLDCPNNINLLNTSGLSALHMAVELHNEELVDKMIASGRININSWSSQIGTALHLAVQKNYTKIAQKLIETKGIDLNLVDGSSNTVLHLAVSDDQDEVVEMLLAAEDIDVNVRNRFGSSPLHLAMNKRYDDMAKRLIGAKGMNLNLRFHRGETPLMLAFKKDFLEIVEELIESGVNVDVEDIHGNTVLHLAIQDGNIDVVRQLIAVGADVNVKDERGNAALHLAIEKGSIEMVGLLIDAEGVDLNLANENGSSPLMSAIENEKAEIVDLLIEAGADVSSEKNGTTPLILAIMKGDILIMEKLIATKGVNVNAVTELGKTPLHEAIIRNDVEMVEVLLSAGADVGITDQFGKAPLHFAAEKGNIEIVQKLLAAGADMNLLDKNAKGALLNLAVKNEKITMAKHLIDSGADVNAKDKNGNAALHLAIKKESIEMVGLLINAEGVDLNLENQEGHSPLHLAIIRKNMEIIDLLIETGVNINFKNRFGSTPLHVAIQNENIDILDKLLKVDGIDVNIYDNVDSPLLNAIEVGNEIIVKKLLQANTTANVADKDGKTPLHLAIEKGNVEILDHLLKAGADVNVVDKDGKAPLHVAIFSNRIESVVKLLAVECIDVNIEGEKWPTPLIIAAAKGRVEILDHLLKAGADVNAKDFSGKTSLHAAIFFNKIESVEKLLAVECIEVNAQSQNGRTALHDAVIEDNLRMVEILLGAGADVSLRDNDGKTALEVEVFDMAPVPPEDDLPDRGGQAASSAMEPEGGNPQIRALLRQALAKESEIISNALKKHKNITEIDAKKFANNYKSNSRNSKEGDDNSIENSKSSSSKFADKFDKGNKGPDNDRGRG